MEQDILINWLCENKNPAVKYRTQTELLNETPHNTQLVEWIYSKLPDNWHETNGLWYRYYITALAECGLTLADVKQEHLKRAFNELENSFACGCADFLLLRALVKLGFAHEPIIKHIINNLRSLMLPDNGFLCSSRVNNLNYTPKSCYKNNLHALMFFAECNKQNCVIPCSESLINYFLNHNIFYKTNDKNTLVINSREGWRTIDCFYPFEVMRVGLQNVVESFCALGYGNDKRLNNAWQLLNNKKNDFGQYILDATLTKSYLPKEKVGNPSKWVTFYAMLAEKERMAISAK